LSARLLEFIRRVCRYFPSNLQMYHLALFKAIIACILLGLQAEGERTKVQRPGSSLSSSAGNQRTAQQQPGSGKVVVSITTKKLIDPKSNSSKKLRRFKARSSHLTSDTSVMTVVAPVRLAEDLSTQFHISYTCECSGTAKSCVPGECTAISLLAGGDPVIISPEGQMKKWHVNVLPCGGKEEHWWTVSYTSPQKLLTGATFVQAQWACSGGWGVVSETLNNGWFDIRPKLASLIGLGTCLVVASDLDTETGSNNPISPDDMSKGRNQFLNGGSYSVCSDVTSCSTNQFDDNGKVKTMTAFQLDPSASGRTVPVKTSINVGSWSSEGETQNVYIQPFSSELTSDGNYWTLAQWAAVANVGPWCLLVANKDAFKASYYVKGPITVPVCLSADNLTAMSTMDAYPFLKAAPSDWDMDEDLLIRMGPLLMQVYSPLYKNWAYMNSQSTVTQDLILDFFHQFSNYMTASDTADLIAAYRFSDRDFDAWVQKRDTAANRTFNCAPEDLNGLVGSCWCNASVPSGDICNAILSMSQLPVLHSQPETIGRLLRRQGSNSKIRSLSQEEKLLPPEPFRFPWRDFPQELEADFLDDVCPSIATKLPCLSFRQCAKTKSDPATDPSAPPNPPYPPLRAPPSPSPYVCKRDKRPGPWYACSAFSIKDGAAKIEALRDMLESGCETAGSCKTTTFSSMNSPGVGFLPLFAKFKLKLCPLDIESLDTGIHGWYVDLPIFDTPVFLNNSGIFEKEVLAIKFGVQAEICIACTGVKEVDETLDFLSDQFYVNLCFAKIDGYYFPMDGRLQLTASGQLLGLKYQLRMQWLMYEFGHMDEWCNCPSPQSAPLHCMDECLYHNAFNGLNGDVEKIFYSFKLSLVYCWFSKTLYKTKFGPKMPSCKKDLPTCERPPMCDVTSDCSTHQCCDNVEKNTTVGHCRAEKSLMVGFDTFWCGCGPEYQYAGCYQSPRPPPFPPSPPSPPPLPPFPPPFPPQPPMSPCPQSVDRLSSRPPFPWEYENLDHVGDDITGTCKDWGIGGFGNLQSGCLNREKCRSFNFNPFTGRGCMKTFGDGSQVPSSQLSSSPNLCFYIRRS